MNLFEEYINTKISQYLGEQDDDDKIKKTKKVGCAVIVKEGENGEKLVLLIRRAPDDHWPLHYDMPRGGCDYGKQDSETYDEPTLACVKRECKEECGLDIEIVRSIDEFQYLAEKGTVLTTQYNFLCKMKDPNQKVKLSKEHDDYEWIQSVGQAELYLLPEMKKTIAKVLNQDNPIIDYSEAELDDHKIGE